MKQSLEEAASEYINIPPVKAAIKCGDIEDIESHIKVAFKNGAIWMSKQSPIKNINKERFDHLYNRILDGGDWDYSTLDELLSLSETNGREKGKDEVKKKALQSYCLDSCLMHDVNDREKILSCCNEGCPLVAKFIKNLE